jgi:hypothetical protein
MLLKGEVAADCDDHEADSERTTLPCVDCINRALSPAFCAALDLRRPSANCIAVIATAAFTMARPKALSRFTVRKSRGSRWRSAGWRPTTVSASRHSVRGNRRHRDCPQRDETAGGVGDSFQGAGLISISEGYADDG